MKINYLRKNYIHITSFILEIFLSILAISAQTISVIPTKVNSKDFGFRDLLINYDDTLYFVYQDSTFRRHLAKFDGNKILVIQNLNSLDYGFYSFNYIVYHNCIFSPYLDSLGNFHLAKYDGNSLNLINIDNSADEIYDGFLIIFNDKLYFQYKNTFGKYQLAQYDGNAVTLFPNPSIDDEGLMFNLIALPVQYKNALYLQYRNIKNMGEEGE